MPFRDGSGPNGNGPLTGRGMGDCNAGDAPRNRNYGSGMGRAFGRGRGRGFGRRNDGYGRGYRRFDSYDVDNTPNAYNDKSYLESMVKYLTDRLTFFKNKLNDSDD